jgi:hypothetical protein
MKTVDTKEITADQTMAVIKAAKMCGALPIRGTLSGTGIQVPMPASVTDADLASGDSRRWAGWTFVGPQDGVITLDDMLVDAINGKPDKDGNMVIMDKKVEKDARDALKKAKDESDAKPVDTQPTQPTDPFVVHGKP